VRLGRSLEEYKSNGGWSSHFFAENAVKLIQELKAQGVEVTIGRTVIHLVHGGRKLKAYVHHNGRTEEYATITDQRGAELITVHHTQFDDLRAFIRAEFNL